jgi:hypothetical protein
MVLIEDCDFRMMASCMLGKHTLDASFGQQRTILEYVALKRDVFVGRVDRRVAFIYGVILLLLLPIGTLFFYW